MTEKKARGPSAASKAAGKYLAKNPEATAAELAKKFKVALATIYRAPWWVNRMNESINRDWDHARSVLTRIDGDKQATPADQEQTGDTK